MWHWGCMAMGMEQHRDGCLEGSELELLSTKQMGTKEVHGSSFFFPLFFCKLNSKGGKIKAGSMVLLSFDVPRRCWKYRFHGSFSESISRAQCRAMQHHILAAPPKNLGAVRVLSPTLHGAGTAVLQQSAVRACLDARQGPRTPQQTDQSLPPAPPSVPCSHCFPQLMQSLS